MEKNEQIEQDTVQTAIDNLQTTTGIKADWKPEAENALDGELVIQIQGKPMHFLLEIKQEIRNHHLPMIVEQATQLKNLMVVANRILPGAKEELRQKKIAYLEGNGNIFINKKPIFIWINDNNPLTLQREKTNRAFTRAGLKVVFLFLVDPTYINKPYRTIAEATGTALGNVSNVINGLLEYGFLVRKNDNELLLNDKKTLLNKWITAYDEKLKPILHIGNYRSLEMETFNGEHDIYLNPTDTVWGGESAGDILTNHLRPGINTIYTTLSAKELMKKHRLVPDNIGDVKVYEKFWSHEIYEGRTAPPILVYADLMNMNNKRCRETAQLVYERYIEPEL